MTYTPQKRIPIEPTRENTPNKYLNLVKSISAKPEYFFNLYIETFPDTVLIPGSMNEQIRQIRKTEKSREKTDPKYWQNRFEFLQRYVKQTKQMRAIYDPETKTKRSLENTMRDIVLAHEECLSGSAIDVTDAIKQGALNSPEGDELLQEAISRLS